MIEHQSFSAEYVQDIKTLFTSTPFRGEGGPEINEVAFESRRIVIGQLAGRVIAGDFGRFEEVLSAVADVRPDVAFGMGTNVLDELGQVVGKSEPATTLREWLIELVANDTTDAFTPHDRAWANDSDLDELDAEALLLCISDQWPKTKLRGSLFGKKYRQKASKHQKGAIIRAATWVGVGLGSSPLAPLMAFTPPNLYRPDRNL